MSWGKEPENKNAGHPDDKIFWFVAIGFIAMVAAPGIYIFAFRNYDLGGPDNWGSFATYFSGIVTPIVALCSVVLFFRSIVVQRREFEETRSEMRTANALQVSVENERQKLKKQEHLERAIPIVRESNKKRFNNIVQCNNDIIPGEALDIQGDPFGSFLSWYCDKAIHVIRMINSYLDADGDIYIVIEFIRDLKVEKDEVQVFAQRHDRANNLTYQEYALLLAELMNRRTFELENYSTKWG
ncbi:MULTISPECIES: hypothetical protein [Idiomarina]|uniref:hypothetical protein n=1 Tax=Idiomarina TaxID=135575 RepID=UPI000C452C4A|nr:MULTISPECIES: hypothetical protein [Idiomarina]MBP58033.1 hypothetical protein [Idiomarina sp.]|tara:strand:+ start:6647 stop:7369 length:723 start_codon:yes stop_codon:yes gene_type:complete